MNIHKQVPNYDNSLQQQANPLLGGSEGNLIRGEYKKLYKEYAYGS
jgi:hypothetical protein